MKYKVAAKPDGADVEVTEVQGKEEQLLEAFRECQEGRCSCPTQEYTKLESLQVEQGAGTISLRLKAKRGSQFDPAEIERCLGHTEGRIRSGR
jgi:hypothetical protein